MSQITKDDVRELLDELSRQTQNHHSNMMWNHGGGGYHKGSGWRNCPSQECRASKRMADKYEPLATPRNHNKYALANWKRKIKRASVSLEGYLK